MIQSFEELPYEIHLELSKYLSVFERQLCSQVSAQLQSIYRPISWQHCLVIVDDSILTAYYGEMPRHLRYRCVPVYCLNNPQNFSWLHREDIRNLCLDITLLGSYHDIPSKDAEDTEEGLDNAQEQDYISYFTQPQRDFFNSTFDWSAHPKLQTFRIVNGGEYRSIEGLKIDCFVSDPNNLYFSGLRSFKKSPLYTSLTADAPSYAKTIFQFTAEVNIFLAEHFFHNLSYLKDLKCLNLDFEYLDFKYRSVTLPPEVILPNLEFISLFNLTDNLFLYIVDQMKKWPKLKEFETSFIAQWERYFVRFQSQMKYLEKLPDTLTLVHLTLHKMTYWPAESIASSMIEFLRDDPHPQNRIVLPRVTNFSSNCGFLGSTHSLENILCLPNLECMHIPASLPWCSVLNRSLNVEKLSLLSLYTVTRNEIFRSESAFFIFRNPEIFKSLKHLTITLKTFSDSHELFDNAMPIFMSVRNHYTHTSELPNRGWLTRVIESTDFCKDLIEEDLLQIMILQIFLMPLTVFPLILSALEDRTSDNGFQFLQLCLLEIAAESMLKVPSLEYFSVDFGGEGFISPGLYRLLNFHPNLKQALVRVELVDHVTMNSLIETSLNYANELFKCDKCVKVEENDEFGVGSPDFHKQYYKDEKTDFRDDAWANNHYSTFVFDPDYRNLLIATYRSKIHLESKCSPNYTVTCPLSAQIFVDVARKRTFQPDMKNTFTKFPIPKSAEQDFSLSNQSDLFVASHFEGMQDCDKFTHYEQLEGWM